MSQNHLADNKAIYMKEKSGIALEECFQRCSRGKQDYKTVTNRELTCIGNPIHTQNTAPSNSPTPTPTPSTSSTTEASADHPKLNSGLKPSKYDSHSFVRS